MPLRRLLPLLAVLLVLTVSALVARLVLTEASTAWRAGRAAQRVGDLKLALQAAEMVSRERGPTNAALGEPMPPSVQVQSALTQARERTDVAYAALQQILQTVARDSESGDMAARRVQEGLQALGLARATVDRLRSVAPQARDTQALRDAVAALVAVVPTLAPAISVLAHEAQQELPQLNDAVQGARLSAELREYAGLLGSHFTAPLVRQQPFTNEERAAIGRTRGRIDELRFLIGLRAQLPGQRPELLLAWQEAEEHYFTVAMQLVAEVLEAGERDGRYGMDPRSFAARYVPDMNKLFHLRDSMLNEALSVARREGERATWALAITGLGVLALALLLAAGLLVLRRRVLQPLAGITDALGALARSDLGAALPQARVQDEMAAVIGAVRELQDRSRERLALEAERDALIAQLRDQSSTDFLTGLPNRRAFFDAAERELARSRRQGQVVSLIMLDIDHFKQFNDLHGHRAGDEALVQVGKALGDSLRAGDLVARYGGEEFVLLLCGCDRPSARAYAERLRLAIAGVRVSLPSEELARVSASLGVADSGRCGLDLDTLLSQADAAMYQAKSAGRDRVRVAGERDERADRGAIEHVRESDAQT